jgi:hypothetical protein
VGAVTAVSTRTTATCRLCERRQHARGLCRRHYEMERAFDEHDEHVLLHARQHVDRQLGINGMCQCAQPDPRRLDGFLLGLELYECTRCGRKLNGPAT